MYKNTSAVVSSSLLEKDPAFQMITITKETGLGLKILGGINRNEGPLVYIQEIIPGGDCYKDGRLKPGDQLVSVNKESMIGVSFEEAKRIITRAKLRSESAWEIAFIRQKSDSNHPEKLSCTSLLEASEEYGPQASTFSLLSSPPEILIPKTSSTPKINDIKTGYNKTEQTPITSSDNSTTDMSNTGKCTFNFSFLLFFSFTLSQQQVQADSEGTVAFGDFVQVAKNLFCLQLDEVNVGAHEISNILDSQLLPCDSLEADEIERLKRERNDALKEVNILKEAKAVVEESRALRSRIHLAEAAQRQAHGMEMDYEEVIRLLEGEITELKAQLADYSDQNKENVQDLRKRITVLDCQLRKSEMARKTFEESTEKLLHFVEAIQEIFSENSAPLSNLSERRAMLASKTSLTSLGRNGRNIPATLALESKELVKSVRAVLDMDCLPYGWEEAYTADGIKYFINHVTQTTSWIHPVMSVLNLSCSEGNEEDCSREPPDQKC
uniref:Syntaxin-binding protein 4 n=1 Tax=Propithecus coquereli TaxID=379532 RepID=A0A2K6GA41_PROCO